MTQEGSASYHFARTLQQNKIQIHYRQYIEDKLERERINFEQTKKRIAKNYARAVIRKYTILYLKRKKHQKEILEYHKIYHLHLIVLIQSNFRAWKHKPKKLDVKRFKSLFYSTLVGWKIRRILSYMKTLPEIKEAIDYVKLRSDLKGSGSDDMFSRQIIAQFPKKIKMFHNKFNDLLENAIWIK